MNIIFLDIDGVLNTEFTYYKRHFEYLKTGKIISEIDEHRVKYLKEIIEKTGAKIVLSSSWKNYIKKEGENWIPAKIKGIQLITELKKQGLEIYDVTPNGKNRQDEIQKYLQEHPEIEKYVIIDDETSHLKEYWRKEEFIKTSIKKNDELVKDMKDCYGLCYEHVQKIIKYFNKQKIISKGLPQK